MPSLRRTASTPVVRASPYSTSSLVARGNGHRRSSGSETSNRRVLADIEWWRVTEGQCHHQAMEDRNRGIQDLVSLDMSWSLDIPVIHVEGGVEHTVSLPRTTAGGPDSNETSAFEPPTEQFSTLAITPPRRHDTLESSSSSLESTPETANASLTFDIEVAFEEASLPPLPVQRRSRFNIPVMKRSFTFADCLSLKDDHPWQYADFATSPLSSTPDFLN